MKTSPKTSLHNQQGFTLIELLVTVLIIGILSAVAVFAINPQRRIAQTVDANRIADLKQISSALEAYYVANGEYPAPCTQFGPGSCTSANNGFNWIPGLVEQDFLKAIPIDPRNDGFSSVYGNHLSYFYISETAYGGTDGDYYILGAWLEDDTNQNTLDNLGGDPAARPKWPDCSALSDILFSGNIYIIRSYSCDTDPQGAL